MAAEWPRRPRTRKTRTRSTPSTKSWRATRAWSPSCFRSATGSTFAGRRGLDLHHERGRVVAPATLHRIAHQPLRRIAVPVFGGAEEVEQLAVEEPLHQPVRAEQEEIARFAGDDANLRIDKLVPRAERLLQDGAAGMIPRLAFVELAVAEEPADVRVVVAQLPQPPLPRRQIVNAAVSNVPEHHPPRRKPTQAQGRSHPLALRVAPADEHQRPVDLVEQFAEHVATAGLHPRRRLHEGARQEMGYLVHGDSARVFPDLRAAHPVADREDEIRRLRGRLPGLPKQAHFPRVELQAEEAVLVILAHLAAMRLPVPLEAVARVIHLGRGRSLRTRNR